MDCAARTPETEGEAAVTKQAKVESFSPGERFLTIPEVAEVLRLSTRTVREHVKRDEILGKIIRKRWRFRRADLDAFFETVPSEWHFAGECRQWAYPRLCYQP
jgi:excisionase family DNA binding protein